MSTGRIDVVTIFPTFFDALDISLLGRARRSGSLDIEVHDLRAWTTDRHRTVDDTPAGGGAGMVMRPDVWGRALDEMLPPDALPRAGQPVERSAAGDADAVLIIPTPGGEPFTQRTAEEFAAHLSGGGRIVIACGRYEGIDARVGEHYRERAEVREVSIGDYVLNGGESAALVMIEAIARLVPGFVGNPESLLEESHGQTGLLEYPVYTQPATWRGLNVPEVLRSGDHAKIAAWRRAQALARTARVRPDLLTAHEATVRRARPSDAAVLHEIAARTFPLACPPGFDPALAEEFVATNLSREAFRTWARSRDAHLWVAEIAGVPVGYSLVLLRSTCPQAPEQERAVTADLNKFYVLPEHHGSGAAHALMAASLAGALKAGMGVMWLGVNQQNRRAQSFYTKHGFETVATRTFDVGGSRQGDFVMERAL